MGNWSVASQHTNGIYKTIFKANKKVSHETIPLGKKIALGSGLVLGNIATLGLVNLGILSWMRFRSTGTKSKKQVRRLYIDKQVCLIMATAVKRTPGHAPPPPNEIDAANYTMHVLGLGRKGSGDIVNNPQFLAWWQYFIDPNNFVGLKQQLATLIEDEGLRQVI